MRSRVILLFVSSTVNLWPCDQKMLGDQVGVALSEVGTFADLGQPAEATLKPFESKVSIKLAAIFFTIFLRP